MMKKKKMKNNLYLGGRRSRLDLIKGTSRVPQGTCPWIFYKKKFFSFFEIIIV